MCYPFGQEYMRAHRAFRQLANMLARNGYHVLRFDFLGTGDSARDLDAVTPRDWLQDIDFAINELRAISGVSNINVIGLRLGALIAGHACAARDDVAKLILWDPFVAGGDYEQELLREIARPSQREPGAPPKANLEASDGTISYNGFDLTPKFRSELRSLDLLGVRPAGDKRVLQIVSHESERFAALQHAWEAFPQFSFELTPAPHDWNFVDNYGAILLPHPVMQAIVKWLD